MDFIFLRKLEFCARLGLTEEERLRPQRVRISIKIGLDLEHAMMSDYIGHTINYASIRKEVQKIVECKQFSLLENMAGEIVRMILSHQQPHQVRIILCKPEVRGNPAILIDRRQTA